MKIGGENVGYSTSQFTKLLGVSIDSLRHYERNRIFAPIKNPCNNYRQYSNQDGLKVLTAKLYRSFDVPVVTVSNIMNGVNEEGHLNLIEQKKNEIKQEIQRLQLLKLRLEEIENLYQLQCEAIGTVQEIQLPPIYRIRCDISSRMTTHAMKQWIEHLPYTVLSMTIPLESILEENEIHPIHLGLHAQKQYVEQFNLYVGDPVEVLPGGLGLCLTISVLDVFSISQEQLMPLIQKAKENSYRLLEDLSVKLEGLEVEEGQVNYVISIRVAVKKV